MTYAAWRDLRADGVDYRRGEFLPMHQITDSWILKETGDAVLANSDEGINAASDYQLLFPGFATDDPEPQPQPRASSGSRLTVSESDGRRQLIAAGYDDDVKVLEASDDELLALDYIGNVRLARIRAHLAGPQARNQADGE